MFIVFYTIFIFQIHTSNPFCAVMSTAGSDARKEWIAKKYPHSEHEQAKYSFPRKGRRGGWMNDPIRGVPILNGTNVIYDRHISEKMEIINQQAVDALLKLRNERFEIANNPNVEIPSGEKIVEEAMNRMVDIKNLSPPPLAFLESAIDRLDDYTHNKVFEKNHPERENILPTIPDPPMPPDFVLHKNELKKKRQEIIRTRLEGDRQREQLRERSIYHEPQAFLDPQTNVLSPNDNVLPKFVSGRNAAARRNRLGAAPRVFEDLSTVEMERQDVNQMADQEAARESIIRVVGTANAVDKKEETISRPRRRAQMSSSLRRELEQELKTKKEAATIAALSQDFDKERMKLLDSEGQATQEELSRLFDELGESTSSSKFDEYEEADETLDIHENDRRLKKSIELKERRRRSRILGLPVSASPNAQEAYEAFSATEQRDVSSSASSLPLTKSNASNTSLYKTAFDEARETRATPLGALWTSLGGEFGELNGAFVPTQFGIANAVKEYRACRESTAVFDDSWRYIIEIRGRDRNVIADRLLTCPLEKMDIGDVQYGCILDSKGYIIDDGFIANLQGRILIAASGHDREGLLSFASQFATYSSQYGLDVKIQPSLLDSSVSVVGKKSLGSLINFFLLSNGESPAASNAEMKNNSIQAAPVKPLPKNSETTSNHASASLLASKLGISPPPSLSNGDGVSMPVPASLSSLPPVSVRLSLLDPLTGSALSPTQLRYCPYMSAFPVRIEWAPDAFSPLEFEPIGFRKLSRDGGKMRSAELVFMRTSITGEEGYTIIGAGPGLNAFTRAFLQTAQACADLKIKVSEGGVTGSAAGLFALDMLRMEAGFPRAGVDMNHLTTPVRASLAWCVDQSKLRNHILFGWQRIFTELAKPPSHRRIGLVVDSTSRGGRVYAGCQILSSPQRRPIGEITSVAWSPTLKRKVAMGYVSPDYAYHAEPILVRIPLAVPEGVTKDRKKALLRGMKRLRDLVPGRIVRLPFVGHEYAMPLREKALHDGVNRDSTRRSKLLDETDNDGDADRSDGNKPSRSWGQTRRLSSKGAYGKSDEELSRPGETLEERIRRLASKRAETDRDKKRQEEETRALRALGWVDRQGDAETQHQVLDEDRATQVMQAARKEREEELQTKDKRRSNTNKAEGGITSTPVDPFAEMRSMRYRQKEARKERLNTRRSSSNKRLNQLFDDAGLQE